MNRIVIALTTAIGALFPLLTAGADRANAVVTEQPRPASADVYWYNTWAQAPSYPRLGDDRIGWLYPGDNYFYCETYDEWDSYQGNHWYAKTDDDEGHTNVWMPEYFFTAATSPVDMPKC